MYIFWKQDPVLFICLWGTRIFQGGWCPNEWSRWGAAWSCHNFGLPCVRDLLSHNRCWCTGWAFTAFSQNLIPWWTWDLWHRWAWQGNLGQLFLEMVKDGPHFLLHKRVWKHGLSISRWFGILVITNFITIIARPSPPSVQSWLSTRAEMGCQSWQADRSRVLDLELIRFSLDTYIYIYICLYMCNVDRYSVCVCMRHTWTLTMMDVRNTPKEKNRSHPVPSHQMN